MIKNKLKKIDETTKSAVLNMIFRPVSVVLTLIYTPLLLDYLGDVKYGLWVTIMSMISWINYFDVGIGNGLRDVLAKDIANNDREHAKKAVSTAYVILTAIATVLLVITIILAFFLDWNYIFSTTIDMKYVVLISFSLICVNFVLTLMNMVLYALQMSVRVSFRASLIQVLNIVFIVILNKYTDSNLVLLALIYGSSTIIINIINSIQIMHKYEFLRPSIHCFDTQSISQICNVGMKFFVIQIMCMLMFTVDDLLITHFFGAKEVTPFSMANKVYNTAYSFLAAFLVPFWSGTTRALAIHDKNWINCSIKKAFNMWGLYSLGCLAMIFVFKPLMRIWLHQDLQYPHGVITVMCAFYILYGLLAVECQFINGSGKLDVQLIMYIILGISNVPFSVILGVTCSMGVVGIRLATTLLVGIADIVLGINLYSIMRKYNKDIV